MPHLLCLPTELHHDVISAIQHFPEHYHVASNSFLRTSFDTLLSLSLVSKYLRSLSLPYIFRSLILSPEFYGLQRRHCTYLEPLPDTYSVALELVQELKVDMVLDRFIANKKKSLPQFEWSKDWVPLTRAMAMNALQAPDREEMEYLERCFEYLKDGKNLKRLKLAVRSFRCRVPENFPKEFRGAIKHLQSFKNIQTLELNLPIPLIEEMVQVLNSLKTVKHLKLSIPSERIIPILSTLPHLKTLDILLSANLTNPSALGKFVDSEMIDFRSLEDLFIHSEHPLDLYSGAKTSRDQDENDIPFKLDYQVLHALLNKAKKTLVNLTVEESILILPYDNVEVEDFRQGQIMVDPLEFEKLRMVELHLGSNIEFFPPPPATLLVDPSEEGSPIYRHLLSLFSLAPIQTLKVCSTKSAWDMGIWESLRREAEQGGNGKWKGLREIRARESVVKELEVGEGRERRRGREWRREMGVCLDVGKFVMW